MRPELLQAAKLLRSAEPESVGEAIGLLQNTVYSFSMKVCGHPEDAEDTMQEVLLRSLPHLAKIENPRALAVWLYTATRNRCWRMRRRPVDAPKETLSLDELMPDDLELGLLLQDSAPNPESRVLSNERDDLVHKAILGVPPQYRMVLVLHDMEDLDPNLIAQILQIQPGTVRVRLHRARLSVRKEMNRILREMPDTIPSPREKRKTTPLKSGVPQRPPECRDLFANLSEYLDGNLEPQNCEEMQAHIDACPACVAFIRDLRLAIDRCRKLDLKCETEVSSRLRSMMTTEYLRLFELPTSK
jgi:RNA polymerase sigma-70 factor, ECF subfamily